MDILTYINRMNQIYGNEPAPVRYNTQQYLQGGRVGYQDGQLAGTGYTLDQTYPKLEKRAIELLNKGLVSIDVSRQLEKEGIIKVKSYKRKMRPGRGDASDLLKKNYGVFNKYYKRLLESGKLKITEIPKTIVGYGSKSQEEIAKLDDIIVKTFENNPNLSADRIAKLVSTEVGEEVGQGAVTKALKRADIDYVGKARKILPEIEALDKLVKKALVFLKVNQKF